MTDINPSASCTIELKADDLAVQDIFYGWPDVQIGDSGLVFEEDEVHFAATHPLRLQFVDVNQRSAVAIYPPDGDPLRQRFSATLKKHLPTQAWCKENNSPCDPSSFEQEMRGDAVADPKGNGFAFVAAFTADGFGDETLAAVPESDVLYVYRKKFNGWLYCERAIATGEQDTLAAQLKSDYAGATNNCTKFQPVIVSPKESPFSKFKIEPASSDKQKH